jgi:hypothetical protein
MKKTDAIFWIWIGVSWIPFYLGGGDKRKLRAKLCTAKDEDFSLSSIMHVQYGTVLYCKCIKERTVSIKKSISAKTRICRCRPSPPLLLFVQVCT